MMHNERANLPNRNALYLGRSGTGKSQCLKANPEIPESGARVVLFDPNRDHPAHGFGDRAAFARALARADASGQGFRIAYTGEASPGVHEWWCQCVLAVLDGTRITYVIDEEIAGSCTKPGAADPFFRRLLNQGRKYGMRYHGTSQRPQEIPKTAYEACPVLWVGALKRHGAAYLARELGVTAEAIAALEPLEFFNYDETKGREAVRRRVVYGKRGYV